MTARFLVRSLVVAATLALAVPAMAQDHAQGGQCQHGPGAGHMDPARMAQHWQMRAQRLAQRLNLDARQQQQLQALVQQQIARFQSSVANAPPRSPERHAARQAAMQDFDARFSVILSPAQRTQWEQVKQEMRARHEQHRGGWGRGGFGHGAPGGEVDRGI